ncbi:hypothetical protein ACHAW6_015416 [Cyclotella cf. meneghiniana]
MSRIASAACLALACLSSRGTNAFAPPVHLATHFSSRHPISQSSTSLHALIPHDSAFDLTHHALNAASTFLSTIDSDIASIPDDQFRKVFAGGGLIMLGSVLSTVFVGFLIESNNSYADLVAESYAGQDLKGEESFLDSLKLTPEQKRETEEMIMAFREKKAKKAGTWTEEDEVQKQERVEEKDMFSDYD